LEEFSPINESDSKEGEDNCKHSSGDNNTHGEIVGTIPSPQVDGAIRILNVVNDNERNDVEDDDVVVDNERTDIEYAEVVVVGKSLIPQIQVVRSVIRKERSVKNNRLYIREGDIRIRGRKVSYHNRKTLTLPS
jgi:hypothetical protein